MNSKKFIILTSVALAMVALSTATVQAQMHRAGAARAPANPSHRMMAAPTMATRQFRNGDHDFDDRRFNDHDFDDRFRFRNFVVVNAAFPFFSAFPVFYPYPYYGYNSYGYYPPPVYDGYASPGYQGSTNVSLVVQVQDRLARAGFYHGAIDGVIGDGTHRAIRAYERAHGLPVDGRIDARLLATMGSA